MNIFSEEFRTELYKTIENIENENSEVEVVAIIRKQSEHYRDIPALAAITLSFLLYTILMIIPQEVDVIGMFGIVVGSFFVFYSIFVFFPALTSFLIAKKRKKRSVEVLARAIFQKGGIYFTQNNVGVLFFVSLLEKQVYILPDRGAQIAVPPEEWEKMQADFDAIFSNNDLGQAFLAALARTKEVFAKYLPPVENDINEIPDNLKVEL